MSGQSSANTTVTAPIGAGEAAVALALNTNRKICFDIDKEILSIQLANGRWVDYAYDTIATVTYTIAAKVATVTAST